MASDRFSAFFQRFSARPRRVAVGLAALICCAAAGLFFIPFHHSIDVMLPAESDARMATGYLQSLDFSAKVAIAFSHSGEETDRDELFAEVDRFAASLEPPLVTQVLSTFEEQQIRANQDCLAGFAESRVITHDAVKFVISGGARKR